VGRKESKIKALIYHWRLIYIGIVGLPIIISSCIGERSTPPTLTLAPASIIAPSATASNIEIDLEKDSPRPAVMTPLPPTWTVEPTMRPTQLPLTPTAVQSEPAGESVYYIVKPGDTLGEIADQFNVTVDELAAANDLIDIDHIEDGQKLLIP
jgi:LysM repeat protein